MTAKYTGRTFGLELVMIGVALIFLFPVYVLVNLSFKTPQEIRAAALGLPASPQTSNYSNAWTGAHLDAALINSTIILVFSLLALIVIGSLASYYLARARSRMSYGMYILFLLGIILPFQLALFLLLQKYVIKGFASGLKG
jgi:raffinose/stachyose/melibiose transport system permease protein